ncbi:MAG: hypothetical protein K2X35_24125 [Bryobacteraceae bacterium]|nr:hypothetical protein [Bryobacteraceae bacterium]
MDAFVAAMEDLSFPAGDFHHRDHVRLAWLYARDWPEDGAQRCADTIRRFARHHGAPGKYHHTMTLAWFHLVAGLRSRVPDAGFEAFLEAHPELLDRQILSRYYSAERLGSEQARAGWLEPDLAALP